MCDRPRANVSVDGHAFYTFDGVIEKTIQSIVDNTWTPGSTVFPMGTGSLDFKMTDLVPADVQQYIEAEKTKMIEAGGVAKLIPDSSQYKLDDKVFSWL